MKMEVRLGDQVQLFNNQPEDVVRSFLLLSSEELTGKIQEKTPVDKGKLKGSWTPKLTKDKLTVKNTRNYAVFVEKGTGIFGAKRHRIFPAQAKVMKAEIDGETRYFTNQRGQPGKHMAEKGLMEYRKRIPNLFKTALLQNKAVK